MTDRLYATFSIGDSLFGVDATDVQEILLPQQMTRVPLAPPEVLGLINLRGQVVATIDLRRLLSLEPLDQVDEQVHLVVRTDQGPVAIVVDRVGDVIQADDAGLEDPPPTLVGPTAALVTAVQKLDDHLLLVLDVRRTALPAVAPAGV